ncbi:MAG: hypothetical protein AVDCRST_MAG88-992 [uncultured Thermomicrobiales bacterium]|uniref:Uncharacterized protein n=1 Tax=uncultured Thermomicrobiales bacterium TaxID=1645740 RepID=A0A6J4ULW9_9BACT|nr:MAG: hypothetical protein AVDCRST_MAG88-992 [uncultured Thermomicrobiales bacterium]
MRRSPRRRAGRGNLSWLVNAVMRQHLQGARLREFKDGGEVAHRAIVVKQHGPPLGASGASGSTV